MTNPETPKVVNINGGEPDFNPIVDRVAQAYHQDGVDFTIDRAQPSTPTPADSGHVEIYKTPLNMKGKIAAGAALVGTIATLAIAGNSAVTQAEQEDQGYRQQAVENAQKSQYR